MISLLEGVFTHPLTGNVFAVVSFVLSTIIAFILYRRALPAYRLDYAANDAVILASPHPAFSENLEIFYDGKSVSQVSTTMFAVWNSGNQIIRLSDVVEADPLRVQLFNEAKILQSHIVASTRQVVEAALIENQDKASALISFDFLDPKDGFAIFVAHSGRAGDVTINGTVRGLRGGPQKVKKSRYATKILDNVMGIVLAVSCSVAISIATSDAFESKILQFLTSIGIFVGALALVVSAPDLFHRQRLKRFPKELRNEARIAGLLPHLIDDR